MSSVQKVLTALASDIFVTDPDISQRYLVDFRMKYKGKSAAVLRPRTTSEVVQIVKLCNTHNVPLVPQGGNTGYCGGATPDETGTQLVLSLERMNSIREIDTGNLSMTVDAGCILSDLQDAATEVERYLPLSLGSQQSCQIGGNISTNAGGVSALRYGMARELVMGLEVVLPDGEILSDLHPLRKDNSGYALRNLFAGAEGTLGIVTGASLRLRHKPSQIVTGFLAIRAAEDLMPLLANAQIYTGEAITSFEYISDESLQRLLTAMPHLRHPLGERAERYVLMEAATCSPILDLNTATEKLLEEMFESGMILDGAIAANEQQRMDFWNLREHIPEGEVLNGGSVKHDVSVRTSRMAEFIDIASNIVDQFGRGVRLSVYGHIGDGNVHFNILPPEGKDPQSFKDRITSELSPKIYDLVVKMEGSFSAEYGLGKDKLELSARYGDPVHLRYMGIIKGAIDPENLMNPGKVVNS